MLISNVNGQERLRAATAVSAAYGSGAAIASRSSAPPRQADSISLSEAARSLASATRAVSGAADVREDRVAAIKAALADGTYTVDSSALARSFLRQT